MVRKHKRRLRSKVFTKKRGKTITVGKGNDDKIRTGDTVIDSEGRTGILIGIDDAPDNDFIQSQTDVRVRRLQENKFNIIWYTVFPLTGGAVISARPLTRKLRTKNKRDFDEAFKNANGFAKDTLEALNLW